MKKVLITGGPTNEYIDEVMKITNMATGASSLLLADKFSCLPDTEVTLIGAASLKLHKHFAEGRYKYIPVETTADMDRALKAESSDAYDLVIHSAAVGDYAPEYSFRLEDMAKEIVLKLSGEKITSEEVLNILTNPDCKINDDSKISSYEPHLTVKLGLTPKLIGTLKERFPRARLVGFKLLDKVPKEQLIKVAQELCVHNRMDYIIANDLSDINQGLRRCYLADKNGYAGREFNGNEEIFTFTSSLL